MKKLLSLFTALLFVGTMWGDVISVAIDNGTDTDYASTHSWENATQYDQVVLDANITANRIGTSNNGKYYSDWRFYTTGSTNGSFSINAANDCTLDSVTFTYTVSNSGALYQGNTKLESGTKYKISGTSVTFTTKNTNSSSNGQVRLTAIRVVYSAPELDVNDLSIKTAPTKLNYKVGEELDLTGLVLTADDKDVTSGYTASPANGATLNSVGAQTVAITYGGKTVNQTIHVGELKSIAITTAPTKTEYNEGQTFDPEGMVVEATFSDNESTPTEWTEVVTDYTYPTTALQPENTSVTVSYEWATVEKTANQAITVNAATAYTVTFDAGTGSCATASQKEATGLAGVELPTATIAITGWSFAGWAEAAATNTEVEPTLYAAGTTYHPVENCTLYAVYKFLQGTEGEYIRATSLADVKAASKVILVNGGKTLTTDLSDKDALSETEGIVTAEDKAVFSLSGNDTDGYTLSSASGKIGANTLPSSNSSSTDISITNTNSTWSIVVNTNTDNTFTFLNKGGTNVGLEYYSDGSKWVAYKTKNSPASMSYYAVKVYIPNFGVAYNSNPAAIINPTVAFTTAGDKNLYVRDEPNYTNAANVTGIAKSPVYSSSDETVATVSEAGVVTALKAGSATITAKVAEEIGVHTEAKATYNVTVKDAKTIAGLKAITDASSVVSFTADLTDAVITYVNDNYAYIQDASGAVYASCGSNLTAGTKINGAVSGSIKASYKIDEITAINLDDATITEDGVIPAALTKTVAELIASPAYEGQLVQVSGATVTTSHSSGYASGGKISDDEGTSLINLYAPKSNIAVLQQAQGTFQGYISYYNATSYRLNIYDPSQITITRNAPTDQELAFESNAVVLDHPTAEYDAFVGQTVSGAQTTPVYSIEEGDDEDGVVTSINSETGAIVLSGNEGTATITVTAPAGEIVEAGVTTPWNEATKTYTITVRQLYDVNLVIKVDGEEVAHGNQATLAGGTDPRSELAGTQLALTATRATGYQFVKWTTSSTNIEIAAADSTKTSGLKATVQGAGTIYANFTAVPELLVSATALNLGYAKLNAPLDAKTFKISGASLEEGELTFTLDESIKDAFTVTPNPVAVNGTLAETTITVTPVTTTAGNYSGNLTISGGGLAEDKTVALTSEIEQTYTVTWSVNGEETSQTDIENTTLTPPATGTLAGKVFVGWAEAAIDGATDVKPAFINITKMPAEDKELYAVYATAAEEAQLLTFTLTMVGSDFKTAYDDNKDITKAAVCTTDATVKVNVTWMNNKMCQNNSTHVIQGKSNSGYMYNATPWGKEVKSITINENAYFTSYIGDDEKPSSAGTGAYFYIVAGSSTSTASSIVITFDSTVVATSYSAYITNAYEVTFAAPLNGTLVVENGEDAIATGDKVAAGTTLTVTATPDEGFVIDEDIKVLKVGDDEDVTESVLSGSTLTMPAYAIKLSVSFKPQGGGTGVDNIHGDNIPTTKVLRDNQIYILRGDKTYTIDGQLVK